MVKFDPHDKLLVQTRTHVTKLKRGRCSIKPPTVRVLHAVLAEISAEYERKMAAIPRTTDNEELERQAKGTRRHCQYALAVIGELHRRIEQSFDTESIIAAINHGLWRVTEEEAE